MPQAHKRIVVVGPTGFTGSHAISELLSRKHTITGISRNPAALGEHPLYTGIAVDLSRVSVPELAKLFEGHDILLNCYGPHSTNALAYSPYVEVCRKVVLAAIESKIPYVYQVGGTGSLSFKVEAGAGIPDDGNEFLAGFDGDTVDSNTWWRLYHETIAQSLAHCKYLDVILPPVGTMIRDYGEAGKVRERGEELTTEQKVLLSKFEHYADENSGLPVVEFVKSCRLILMFYEGRQDFRWTFMSPPANYFPCSGSGSYTISKDSYVPFEADGHTLRGISAVDMAKAIADEVESQNMQGRHWTLSGNVPNDGLVAPTYWRI